MDIIQKKKTTSIKIFQNNVFSFVSKIIQAKSGIHSFFLTDIGLWLQKKYNCVMHSKLCSGNACFLNVQLNNDQ